MIINKRDIIPAIGKKRLKNLVLGKNAIRPLIYIRGVSIILLVIYVMIQVILIQNRSPALWPLSSLQSEVNNLSADYYANNRRFPSKTSFLAKKVFSYQELNLIYDQLMIVDYLDNPKKHVHDAQAKKYVSSGKSQKRVNTWEYETPKALQHYVYDVHKQILKDYPKGTRFSPLHYQFGEPNNEGRFIHVPFTIQYIIENEPKQEVTTIFSINMEALHYADGVRISQAQQQYQKSKNLPIIFILLTLMAIGIVYIIKHIRDQKDDLLGPQIDEDLHRQGELNLTYRQRKSYLRWVSKEIQSCAFLLTYLSNSNHLFHDAQISKLYQQGKNSSVRKRIWDHDTPTLIKRVIIHAENRLLHPDPRDSEDSTQEDYLLAISHLDTRLDDGISKKFIEAFDTTPQNWSDKISNWGAEIPHICQYINPYSKVFYYPFRYRFTTPVIEYHRLTLNIFIDYKENATPSYELRSGELESLPLRTYHHTLTVNISHLANAKKYLQ